MAKEYLDYEKCLKMTKDGYTPSKDISPIWTKEWDSDKPHIIFDNYLYNNGDCWAVTQEQWDWFYDVDNLFKGAEFGDKFLTKKGEVALFIRPETCLTNNETVYKVCTTNTYWVKSNGDVFFDGYNAKLPDSYSVVSKCEESIDNDTITQAMNSAMENEDLSAYDSYYATFKEIVHPYADGWRKGFRVGYRKAKNC